MKNVTKMGVILLIMIFGRCIPGYATTYTSLHGADLGTTGNISLVLLNSIPTNFRVLIPPGATYINLSMNCQNQAIITTVTRFGQAPSDYLPLPSTSSSSPKSLASARTGNIFSGNGDGILNITTGYFSPPLAESQAGWLYVDIVGSGVNHIDYDVSVNAAVYTEWYNRKVGSIDCLCAALGQCAMCDVTPCTLPVTADFGPLTAVAGQAVTFVSSTTNATNWSWSAPNANPTSAATQDFTTTFPTSGTFGVSLIATGSGGNCQATKSQNITVGAASQCTAPVTANYYTTPSASGNIVSITAGNSVTFNNSSTVSTGSAGSGSATWMWNFGDGSATSSAYTPAAHTYSTPGTYTATLTATAPNCSATTKQMTIQVGSCTPTVTAKFAKPANSVVSVQEVLFTNTSTKGSALASYVDASWSWSVKNSANISVGTASSQNLPFIFPDGGNYTVTLTATANNCSSQWTETVPVTSLCLYPAVTANFQTTPQAVSGITTIQAGQSLPFSNISTGSTSNATWLWDFGDGSYSTSNSPTHTFPVGTYLVKLTATDQYYCWTSKQLTVSVTQACPTPAVTASFDVPSTNIAARQQVVFANRSKPSLTSAKSWAWDAANSSGTTIQTASSQDFPITFPSAGTYTVTLKATDNNNVTSQSQVNLSVNESGSTYLPGDANADGKLGLDDVIYILQVVCGLRP